MQWYSHEVHKYRDGSKHWVDVTNKLPTFAELAKEVREKDFSSVVVQVFFRAYDKYVKESGKMDDGLGEGLKKMGKSFGKIKEGEEVATLGGLVKGLFGMLSDTLQAGGFGSSGFQDTVLRLVEWEYPSHKCIMDDGEIAQVRDILAVRYPEHVQGGVEQSDETLESEKFRKSAKDLIEKTLAKTESLVMVREAMDKNLAGIQDPVTREEVKRMWSDSIMGVKDGEAEGN